MSELVTNCPRCGSKQVTFDLRSYAYIRQEYGWQSWYEAFCVCRHCRKSTVFQLAELNPDASRYISQQGLDKANIAINDLVEIRGHISQKNEVSQVAPEHLPLDIKAAFDEGAICLAVGCPNAAATMFRLCVDLATRALLPTEDRNGLNSKVRRDLGLRLPWLIDNGLLPEALRELSSCIKEDGNDGAHAGSLKQHDAQDLLEFTDALLERLYTEPKRLEIAKQRRDERRGKK